MLDVIKKRRSIRKYQDKEIEKERVEEILKAVMMAPSAHNGRPWRFWVVRDKERKEKLSQAQPYASFAAQAPIVLVIGSDKDRLWVEDCSLVAGLIYLEATNQGLGTCWIQIREMKTAEGKDTEEEVKKILGCPQKIHLLCMMPLGYPAETKPEHSEKEFERKKIVER
jgi:nitroreductase